jgi:hypothetical protein
MPRDNYARTATVLYWHDADTVRVMLDLGYYNHTRAWIRLLQYDAPEAKKRGHAAAFARVNELAPPGSLVVVQTTERQPKSFDRWLGSVWQPSSNLSIADIMIGEHLTKADFAPGGYWDAVEAA